jgi:hypothetical protein
LSSLRGVKICALLIYLRNRKSLLLLRCILTLQNVFSQWVTVTVHFIISNLCSILCINPIAPNYILCTVTVILPVFIFSVNHYQAQRYVEIDLKLNYVALTVSDRERSASLYFMHCHRNSCTCSEGDANAGGLLGFSVVTSFAPTCSQAAVDSCKIATNMCTAPNKHHSSAKCSDGTVRSGSGRFAN